jgi:hypothetical protein
VTIHTSVQHTALISIQSPYIQDLGGAFVSTRRLLRTIIECCYSLASSILRGRGFQDLISSYPFILTTDCAYAPPPVAPCAIFACLFGERPALLFTMNCCAS